MNAPTPGTRVNIHGKPYRGRTGTVIAPPHHTSVGAWPVWVRLDNPRGWIEDCPKGFNLDEVTPE